LIIEFTSTNENVGVLLFLCAVRWETVKFCTPHGRQIFEASAVVRLFRQGGADLLLERAATTFRPLLLLAVLLLTRAIVAVTLRSVQPLRV
jgi:hypothetical protein